MSRNPVRGSGSSPRMRGAHRLMSSISPQMRIIPAYAGSTYRFRETTEYGRDHPRVCGEHFSRSCESWSGSGSSPRMRGAPRLPDSRIPVRGIIPAYAGSTSRLRRAENFDRDHPRVCGEHRTPTSRSGRWGGIIPAYAGSTVTASRPPARSGDHPRVCGEHRHRGLGDLPRQGSSPRMRGAHSGLCSERAQCGIIPAYAGSTLRAVQ